MEEVETKTGEEAREVPPIPTRKVIKKVNHKFPDPLIKDFVFVVTDTKGVPWAYRVYDERSRGRKFIERLGVVVEVPAALPDAPEVELPPEIREEVDHG